MLHNTYKIDITHTFNTQPPWSASSVFLTSTPQKTNTQNTKKSTYQKQSKNLLSGAN